MSGSPQLPPSLLERLDLALASRLASGRVEENELLAVAQRVQDRNFRTAARDAAFVGGLLRLRGFTVFDEDVREVLAGASKRFTPQNQEHHLVHGLFAALRLLREHASRGRSADGKLLLELWRLATAGVPRLQGAQLRKDAPWDGLLYVRYPDEPELPRLLATFDEAHRFRDFARTFDALHPVRQSFRVLWRFARIAPFPDLNLPLAWLAMCAHLLAKGYPALLPQDEDRAFVSRLVAGPPPLKLAVFEGRLLAAVENA